MRFFSVIPTIFAESKISYLDKDVYILFVPRRTTVCIEALELFNVSADLTIKDFNFDLIPLEKDLLSLEMEHFFKDYYLGNDLSLLQFVSVIFIIKDSIERF